MPVTKYRGRPTITDNIYETFGFQSTIATENVAIINGLSQSGPVTPTAFLDRHTGTAFYTMTVAGSAVVAGDVVSVLLKDSNAANIVTPSYTAIGGDTTTSAAVALVAAINASIAVVGGSAYLGTASNSGPVITLMAKLAGSIYLNTFAQPSASPGTAGHLTLSSTGSTLFSPQNPQLHLPTTDANLMLGASMIQLTGGEPIMLDSFGYAAALAAGVAFNY
jgi:hypothetical protein